MVDFQGINVGQYTSPMDGMGVFVNHRCMLHGWMYCPQNFQPGPLLNRKHPLVTAIGARGDVSRSDGL